jgi:hypothetical protein
MSTYNLFRGRERPELLCAAPEDAPVPAFITGPPWEFVGTVDDSSVSSMTFNHEAADVSVRFNGFYLFQLINASDLRLFVRGESEKDGAGETQARHGHSRRAIPSARDRSRVTMGGGFDTLRTPGSGPLTASL